MFHSVYWYLFESSSRSHEYVRLVHAVRHTRVNSLKPTLDAMNHLLGHFRASWTSLKGKESYDTHGKPRGDRVAIKPRGSKDLKL